MNNPIKMILSPMVYLNSHNIRPREYKGMTVPDVLLSGNHANIENGDMNKN